MSNTNTTGQPAVQTSTQYGPIIGTPIAQRSGAIQASLATSTSAYTTATTALLNEIQATFVALGLWKGAA